MRYHGAVARGDMLETQSPETRVVANPAAPAPESSESVTNPVAAMRLDEIHRARVSAFVIAALAAVGLGFPRTVRA